MFNVGDRVEATTSCSYHTRGDVGTVDQSASEVPWVKWDNGRRTATYSHDLKLITEEPMNVIAELEKSLEESKTTLARLEGLLVEEQAKAKKEEAAIRVGDIVVYTGGGDVCTRAKHIAFFSGAVIRVSEGTLAYCGNPKGVGSGPVENYTLIHRPTKEAK